MSYPYTYDARQDYVGFENLSNEAQGVGNGINRLTRDNGGDRIDLLRKSTASAEAKAELADLWGGPGAGAEFLR